MKRPNLGSSSLHFPSMSAINSSDMDMGANSRLDLDLGLEGHGRPIDLSCEQDTSEDEEIVAMQLFTDNRPSSPVRPSSVHNFESSFNKPRPLSSPLKSRSSPHPRLTPTPPSPPLSPQLPLAREHSPAPPPSHDHDPYQYQVQARTEIQTETQTQTQTHGPEFASEPELAPNSGSQPDPTSALQGFPVGT